MVTLKSATPLHTTCTKVEYDVSHSTPGREGTTLTCPMILHLHDGGRRCLVNLDLNMGEGPTPVDAIDKLINNMERMIAALKDRHDTWLPL